MVNVTPLLFDHGVWTASQTTHSRHLSNNNWHRWPFSTIWLSVFKLFPDVP